MLLVLNWKANISRSAAIQLADKLTKFLSTQPSRRNATIVIAPPVAMLADIANITAGSGIKVAAQDCSRFDSGSYTGETTASSLWEYGCQYVILGHSERREAQHETNELVAMKAAMVQKCNMIPVICVGEPKVEAQANIIQDSITVQLLSSLPEDKKSMQNKIIVVAYEPVWAIGTDQSPTPAHIEHVAGVIRNATCKVAQISDQKMEVLYGGSVNPLNCRDILKTPGVGGLLVGRASLVYDDIIRIISTALDLAKVAA
jgi:triosephosphate isomerase